MRNICKIEEQINKLEIELLTLNENRFDEATNNWFYITLNNSDVPQHILNILEKYAIKVYSSCKYKTDCDENCQRWLKIFNKNGIKSIIVNGYYISPEEDCYDAVVTGEISPPGLSDHVWLMIENNILFDPTAGQFGTNISLKGYLSKNAEQLYM